MIVDVWLNEVQEKANLDAEQEFRTVEVLYSSRAPLL